MSEKSTFDSEMPEQIFSRLRRLNIPQEILTDLPSLPNTGHGLMVYGSRARGDHLETSDLDLLCLASYSQRTVNMGLVSMSVYTKEQLESSQGTLFGMHLHRDAKILWDPTGELGRLLKGMGDINIDRLLSRVLRLSTLFTTLDRDIPRYLPGLLREARYLLRSALYAKAIESGHPCFSVRELAQRHNDPQLSRLLTSRPTNIRYQDLEECLKRLQNIVGEFPRNVHGSLEATVVNEWEVGGDLLSMAFMALGVTGQEDDYAEVGKILL